MERENSGAIDLFAIHARTKALESTAPPPDSTRSSPPAPVTMNVGGSSELSSLDDDDLEVPFASTNSRRKPIFVGLGIVGVLAIIGIVALSGGDDGASKAAAAAAPVAPPSTAPTPPPRPPVVEPAASPSTIASAPTPAKAPAQSKPNAARAPARPASTGPKLVKVQSSGVP
jgi:hypothetical protein